MVIVRDSLLPSTIPFEATDSARISFQMTLTWQSRVDCAAPEPMLSSAARTARTNPCQSRSTSTRPPLRGQEHPRKGQARNPRSAVIRVASMTSQCGPPFRRRPTPSPHAPTLNRTAPADRQSRVTSPLARPSRAGSSRCRRGRRTCGWAGDPGRRCGILWRPWARSCA